MATLFNSNFRYIELSEGRWNDDGAYEKGVVSVRNVRGTVQTMNAQDAAPYADGSRNLGFVKVYSSERLNARKEGGNQGGFVFLDGNFFQLLDSMPNINNVISHYKYVAGLMDSDSVPEEVKAAVNG